MSWQCKALNVYAEPPQVEWFGPKFASMGEACDLMDRLRYGVPANEEERGWNVLYGGGRWRVSIDSPPEPAG